MTAMSQTEPPASPEPEPQPAAEPVRRGGYRPASASAAVAWWALALVLGWLASVVVALVVAFVASAAIDDSAEFADLGAVVLGLMAAVGFAYVWLLVAAVLMARRFVPPARRTAGWWVLVAAVLAAGGALAAWGFVRVEEGVLAAGGVVLAVLVPVLVVPRMRPRVVEAAQA